MKLPALLTSDLHVVDSPSAQYRWGLWPWLAEQVNANGVKTLVINGDLTDAKDNHSAALVNRVVTEVRILKQKCPGLADILFNTGNHDWLKQGQEFFKFLGSIPGVTWFSEPTEQSSRVDRGEASLFVLPYSKHPAQDWAKLYFPEPYEYLLIHQTVKGSVSSNGQEMEGEDLVDLTQVAQRVFSGDIHVPQTIKTAWGAVKYIGSPYHVHFGDNFTPRCVLIGLDRKETDLHFETIKRVTVKATSLRHLMSHDLREKDQVKVRLVLGPEERHEWSRLRREAAAWLRGRGVEVHGIELVAAGDTKRVGQVQFNHRHDPAAEVQRFVEREELGGHALDMGMDLL